MRLLEEDNRELEEVKPDELPLDTGVKIIRQMPNNEESKKLADRADKANQAGSFITLVIFIV